MRSIRRVTTPIPAATVSRRAASVRTRLRAHLAETFTKYSFSDEEQAELARNGLEPNPNKADDAAFDAAVAEVVHRIHLQPHPTHVTPASAGAPGPRGSTLGRVVRAFLPNRRDPSQPQAHR
jgi:hypothetical protein